MVAGEIAKHGFRTQTDVIEDGMFVSLDLSEGSNSIGNSVTRDVMERIFLPFTPRAYKPSYGLMGVQDSYVFCKDSASTLMLREELHKSPLSVTEQRIMVDSGVDSFYDVSLLVALPVLIHPTTVELLVEFKGSQLLPILSGIFAAQEKLTWTELTAAYRFLRVRGIPKHHGSLKLVVVCRSERPMDGTELVVN
jgi:hypothetical protein